MDLLENDEFEEDLLMKKQDKQKFKDEILDENFKKASVSINKIKKEEKLKPIKKPFLKFGLFLIIIGIICLLIIEFVPWAYAKYDNKLSGFKNNEVFYYKDSNIDNLGNDTNFSDFFQSTASYKYIGLNSDDIKSFTNLHTYILITIIVIGIIFTIFSLLLKSSDFPVEKYKLFHCFFAFITALLCIYFIFVTLKFLGANILIVCNSNFISSTIENLSFMFITPIVLIFIVSGILKMATTILKINFNEFEKIIDEKTTSKYLKSLNYGAKLK